MENMLNFAEAQTVAPAPAHTLDFHSILTALGLATEEPAAPAAEEPAAVIEDSMTIEFDSPFECEAFTVERNGIIVRFMRNQQVDCVKSDRYGQHRISARMTRVFFLNKDGGLIGETAVLPVVKTQSVADMLVWRAGVMPAGDVITLL